MLAFPSTHVVHCGLWGHMVSKRTSSSLVQVLHSHVLSHKLSFEWDKVLTYCQWDALTLLAATKQLNEWYFPSVCLSVCLSVTLLDCVPIIVSSWNFQELFPMTEMTSLQNVKVRGQSPPVGSGTPAFRLGSRIDPHHHRGVVKVHWRVPWVGGLFSWVVATFTL